MKIALVGYGKMGREIHACAEAKGHEVSLIIDDPDDENWGRLQKGTVDAVIEFTHPRAVSGNLVRLLDHRIPVICGTTGWEHNLSEMQDLYRHSGGTLITGANFSIGVNILFKINKMLANLMNTQPKYDVYLEEVHHAFKADAPGGTALRLGNDILAHLERKNKLVSEELRHRAPEHNEICIGFARGGNVPGTHRVTWRSPIDRVTIEHEAYSRSGFAEGAVVAAEWTQANSGVCDFSDIFTLS